MNRYENILKNPKVTGKVMSQEQLELILQLGCKYEGVHSPNFPMTVLDASDYINTLLQKIKANQLTLRTKPYKFETILLIWYRTYPAIYTEIINRNL